MSGTAKSYRQIEVSLLEAAMDPAAKQVRICYFALLQEERGQAEDSVLTRSLTAQDLYQELAALYHFSLDVSQLRLAINDRFAAWDTVLQANDMVVFIPPVAGG